ncbi:response regulator [Aquabacterium fontiphilum]|uniref:ATP-binding protein n=1 Tax=Aquabacterium fontiphilum TaxID=450365 RepID=UPI001378ADB7|nr:ATP-binding protein [Aquabacterium fontiphilum]NBD19145.1 response regulator [Aquabacterium fontiphilum]
MLFAPDPARAAVDDPELDRLIRAERLRMLFAPTLQVAVVSALCAAALGLVVAAGNDWRNLPWVAGWVVLCVLGSLLRIGHWRAYLRASDRASPRWLHSLSIVCAVHGAAWGLAGLLVPVEDLVTNAAIVATLVGASAVSTFTLQAHLRPNLATNLPMLTPVALMLLTRQDVLGVFGGMGTLTLLGVMLFESRRAERRITELLWLRFLTDRISKERAEALQLARRNSAVKDQFLATMSHEMRTPLHGILGLSRLVRERLPNRPGVLQESHHQLELIEHTGEHLLEIISDVLDYSRIEAGKLQMDAALINLRPLIVEALDVLQVTAQDKGLRLLTDVRLPPTCWVWVDGARVRQILTNLVGNAIKFTERGEVRVTAQLASRDGADTGSFTLTVEDTGEGIPADQLGQIFEAFHQVDGSFGRKHKGTGLGLTISREMARAMGGDIRCRSVLGEGATFVFEAPMPLRAGVVDAATLPQGAPHPAGSPMSEPADDVGDAGPAQAAARVLLAEDNPVNALVAEATLANLGLMVTRVEDGRQALKALQQVPPPFELVLMDCQMPGLDGLEATRRLRRWEREQGVPMTPVVALTANALAADRDRCLAAGMDGHLAKPFRQEELADVLQRFLPQYPRPAEPIGG